MFAPTKQSTIHTILLLCLLTFGLSSCEQTQIAAPEPVTITIAGATSMHPVLLALTSEFSRRHPTVIFDLQGGGSTIGEQMLRRGEVELAASTLAPTGEMGAQSNEEQNSELQKLFRVPIAIDGLAIIVHRANPVESLSLSQVRDLFSGRIVNWSELDGTDSAVILVSREDGSGARQLFETRTMGFEAVSLTAIVMPTSADVVDFVGKNPQAIAYVSRAYLIDQLILQTTENGNIPQDKQTKVKLLKLEGKLPVDAAIKDASYLLSSPIYLVGRGELEGWNRQFVEFVLGPVGQQIVAQFHARIR